MRGPLRDSERSGSSVSATDNDSYSGSCNAPSPRPSPRTRGEGARLRNRRGFGRCVEALFAVADRLLGRRENYIPNAFDISQHLVIPETQHAIMMLGEPSIPHGVASAPGMLAAIDLDDEPLLAADKIDDVPADRLLTDEFVPAQRSRTKVSPKLSLGGRRVFPQSPGDTCLRYVRATHAARPPHPNLLPARGEKEERAARRSQALYLARLRTVERNLGFSGIA
jgi:hypothetical protein